VNCRLLAAHVKVQVMSVKLSAPRSRRYSYAFASVRERHPLFVPVVLS